MGAGAVDVTTLTDGTGTATAPRGTTSGMDPLAAPQHLEEFSQAALARLGPLRVVEVGR